jgi:hypothetical protein
VKKRCFVPNSQNIGLVNTVFEQLVVKSHLQKRPISSDHIPSDMTNRIWEKVQVIFIILTNLQVLSKEIKLKRS